jgi:hypothetical protein
LLSGHAWPRAPLAAVPCPATLFTIGLLLIAGPAAPRALAIAPLVWAVVGGSAAVTLGVLPDWMLLVAGAMLLGTLLAPRRVANAV